MQGDSDFTEQDVTGLWKIKDMLKRVKGKSLTKIIIFFSAAMILVYLSYLLPSLMPGDYVTAMYGSSHVVLSHEDEVRLKSEYTLEKNFTEYLSNLSRLDLGRSFAYRSGIRGIIIDALPWTLLLVGLSQAVSFLLGFFSGVESSWRRGSRSDRTFVGVMTAFEGFPELATGVILLVVFSYNLGWFPSGGAETSYLMVSSFGRFTDIMGHFFLPFLTLVIAYSPGNFLLVRNSMIITIGEKYIMTARAKGLPPVKVRYRHAARNALLPLVTRIGMRFAFMFTGVLVVETVFSYPGLGTLLYNSISMRDVPLVRGIILVASLLVLIVNSCLDYVYMYLDPRIRDEKRYN